MRRLAPRPLSAALAAFAPAAEPATVLARVQTVWTDVVGPELATRAAPVAERDGVVTVVCESAIWAQEMELLGAEFLPDLRERAARPIERLTFRVGSVPN